MLRTRAGAAGLGALLALPLATPASAQDTSGVTSLQGVQVLGSRIRKADSTTDSPVQTITQDQIAASGLKSVGEILQEMSVSGSALNTKFNSAGNFGFAPDGSGVGSGSTTLSLRNLGAKRTLILVDGLRWVNETSASGVSAAVDLNTIPASSIDRIEILTDGASALYGSDAIAGVVNIITKKKQGGLSLDAYSGWHEIGGGPTSTYDASYGGQAGKYRYFVDVNHFMQTAISSSEWAQSQFPIPGLGLSEGSSATPNTRTILLAPGGTTYGGLCPFQRDPSTGVITGPPLCDITRDGLNTQHVPPGTVPSFPNDFHVFADADRFNYSPYNMLLTPQRRTSYFVQNSYNLTDEDSVYFRATYTTRDSTNQAAPEPIFLGPDAGTYGRPDHIGVDATNPYNPFGVTLDPNPLNGNLQLIGRRPVEGGPRVFDQKVDTLYLATGIEGAFELVGHTYSWDVNADLGNNLAGQSVQGTYNSGHIEYALGAAQADPQHPGQYQCIYKKTGGVIPGCVPLNIFGGAGTITPDMLKWIQYVEHDASHQILEQVTANLSGPIVALPAGNMEFAAGYEYRRLSGAYSPDSIVINNDSNGVPSLPTAGSYNDNDVYAELQIPLLKKVPGARRLDVSLATRHSEYSSFGGTTNSKFGTLWQPVQDVTFKANYAEGFRAPSVGELYGSLNRFDATLTDPCSSTNTPPPSGQILQNCKTLGVPNGEYNQANTQISVLTGGNSSLRPETSATTTAGLTYSPSWIPVLFGSRKLDFDVNFYHIRVENAIQAPDAQALLTNCVDTLLSVYCSGISRVPDGNINGFQDQLANLGTTETQGIDFGIVWQGPKTQYGAPGMNWQTTWTDYYHVIASDSGATEPNVVGVEVADSGIPRLRSNLNLSWKTQTITANWVLRYLSSLHENCGDAAGTATCSNSTYDSAGNVTGGTNKLPSVIYDDVRFEWTLPVQSTRLTLAAGITNLFDQGPPICVSCSLNGYDASNYDLPGRFGYVEAGLKF